jgi:hypothetical protein
MEDNGDYCHPDIVLDYQFLEEDLHENDQQPEFLPGNSVRDLFYHFILKYATF